MCVWFYNQDNFLENNKTESVKQQGNYLAMSESVFLMVIATDAIFWKMSNFIYKVSKYFESEMIIKPNVILWCTSEMLKQCCAAPGLQ